jgi:hypothetical protein|tara:strand:- start:6895 stop:7245 length:351 start_codon:yes stop_codon:yes gene_type:complete
MSDDQGRPDPKYTSRRYLESEEEIDKNEALGKAKAYVKTGKRARGLKKFLDEDWFISKLYNWAENAAKEDMKMDALIRLGQLLHGYFRPYDKQKPQVADVTFTEDSPIKSDESTSS